MPPPGVFRQLVLALPKALPEVGPSRPVLAKDRVIAERIAKEAEAVEPAANGFGLVRVAGHAGNDREVRIDTVADRHAFGRFDDAIIANGRVEWGTGESATAVEMG